LQEPLKHSLTSNVGEWLRGGPDDDVVVSSRARLARNIAGYPFVSRGNAAEIARIEELLRNKIMPCGRRYGLTYYRLDQIEPLVRQLFVERHIVARDFAEVAWVRGVAFGTDERMSLMVNEEDHLRMQVVCGGLQLERAFREVCGVEGMLAEEIPFAFSARYGYLTACPTNVGTGMRASVMVHLPALVMGQEMEKVLEMAHRLQLALRGLYGEGTHGSADFYQLSNRISLGLREEQILERISHAVRDLMKLERDARDGFLGEHRHELHDRIGRALDLLGSASMISSEEALNLLSQVRMGVCMGLVSQVDVKALNELLLLTLPAHLQTIEGRRVGRLERNELRACHLKQRLVLN